MNEGKRQIGICSCPCGQEVIFRIARSLPVDAYRIIRLRGRVVQPKQSAEQLDVQKNVLLNGFDVSTENETIFAAIFQKKCCCTISGEEEKLSVSTAKEFASTGSFLSSAAGRLVISEMLRESEFAL
jgi:hypothetical protein